jgi:DNA polymerase-3 subunit beta
MLYGEAGKLTAVATDSFRLAEKTVPLRLGGSVPQLLLPARNAAELMRILDTVQGEVELYYNDNQISTHVGDIYYTSRLIDGTFPNYKQILPKTFSTEVVVLREDLSSALKSFRIEPSKKSVLLSSRNPDVGEQVSTIKATISGEAVAMNFNGRYLADSLQAISGESVRIQSNGAGKPLVIKDAADASFLYLAMPMNR